jgi:predicted nucleotidyltransferase
MTPLEAALERIVTVAKPDRVILFGSAARGTSSAGSDLDFLVIKGGIAAADSWRRQSTARSSGFQPQSMWSS